PCGWCGRENTCKTQFITPTRQGKAPQIVSDCEYHYTGLCYSSACNLTTNSPCTNVPLQCTLC
ncbi:hypothetical protein BDN70DRAFT_778101, partial [Pholiota conissans]